MEEVLLKMNQLESIILNAKDELEQRIEELRQDNQIQHKEIQEETKRQIEELRQDNQMQHKEVQEETKRQIEELRQDNQIQHKEIQEETKRQIEELCQDNQMQHKEIQEETKSQIEELRQENAEQHKQLYLQICGKMILENTKLERKIKKELQNQFAMGKMKNVEKVRKLNDLDSRVEKNESDIMLCQSEISELKKSIV